MARELLVRHPGLAGGVYLKSDPAPDQAIDIQNMVLEPNGKAYKRLGSVQRATVGAGSARIISAYMWYRIGNSPQLIVHADNGHVYYSTDTTTFTAMSGGSPPFGNIPVSFEAMNDVLYMTDGSNSVQKWNGATLTAIGAAPKGRYLKLWKDTLWSWNMGGSDSGKLAGSAAGDGDTWPGTNFVHVGKGDGDEGTGIFIDGANLVVGKHRRTWQILSPTTLENRVLDYDKGLESHFSVMQFGGDIYYLTRFGIARYIASAPAEIVSGNVEPLFNPRFLDLSRMANAVGYVFGDRIGWSLTRAGQTAPDLQLEYYPQLARKPFTFHRFPARCWLTFRDSSERLFYGSTLSNGFMEGYVGSSEVGTKFAGLIDFRWDDFGNLRARKYLRELRLLGEGLVLVITRKDRRTSAAKTQQVDMRPPGDPKWNDPADVWGGPDEKWGSLGSVGGQAVHPDVYGRDFSVRLTDAKTDILVEDRSPPIFRPDPGNYVTHSHGWSIMGLALQAIEMGDGE